MAMKVNCDVYSLEVCNERITHWTNQIELLKKKNELLEENKRKSTKTLENILRFWIGYKKKNYGRVKSIKRKNEKSN